MNFNNFTINNFTINESIKYIDSKYIGGNEIDLINQFGDSITNLNVNGLNKSLRSLKNNKYNICAVKCFHGTGYSNHDDIYVKGNGILKTNINKRRNSYQSESGYTYFTLYEDSAYTFASLGYPYDKSLVIYECYIPIDVILPDKDQLRNNRQYNSNIGDTLAESIIYGNGFRVKGNVPSYYIKDFTIRNR